VRVLAQLLDQQLLLQEQQPGASPSPFAGAQGSIDPVGAVHTIKAQYQSLAAKAGAADGAQGTLLEVLALLLQLYPRSFQSDPDFSPAWLMGTCHRVLKGAAAKASHRAGARASALPAPALVRQARCGRAACALRPPTRRLQPPLPASCDPRRGCVATAASPLPPAPQARCAGWPRRWW
jgi:hypothetical protein